MTDTPDWTTPSDGERPPPDAPPPGWGQPPGGAQPPPGWGQQPPGWGQQPPGWGGQQQGWGQQPPPGYGQQPPPGYGQAPPPGYGQPPPGYGQPPPAYGGQAGYGGYGQPGPGGYGAPAWGAVKPGVIPLRPLGVGEILDGAITTMRTYPKPTIGLAAIVTTVTTILTLLAQASFVEQLEDQSESITPELFATGLGGLAASVLLGYIATTVVTGMITVVIGQAVLGRQISLGDTWAKVRPRIWALLGASLLSGLILAVAFVLCIVPFFYFWPMLSLATAALVLEGQPVTGALRRSMNLVRPDFWRCLGIVLLGWLLVLVISGVLTVPFNLLAGGGDVFGEATGDLGLRYYLLTGIGAILSGAVTQPIAAGMNALLYVDRRIRLEGMDVTLAAAAAQTGQPGMAG